MSQRSLIMKIIIATQNKGKLKEFKEVLEPLGYEVLSASDLNYNLDAINENGNTFQENALIKARYLHELSGLKVISDDSGIIIDDLPGELGIRSARFMGEDTSYSVKNETILKRLVNIESPKASFHCAIALVGENLEETFYGEVSGIIKTAQGKGGFGYDPIFYPLGYESSFASMDSIEKNKISHRALAIIKLISFLEKSNL